MEELKEKLINLIDRRCPDTPYWDIANSVDDILNLDFETTSSIMIHWLNKNQHPHVKIIIESDRAELVEGLKSYPTKEFIKD